jgi:hypothetical protein
VTRLGPGLLHHCENLPLSRHALQLVPAPFFEHEPGSDDEILDRARDEDLARASQGGHPSPDVHSHSCNRVSDELALAGVHTYSELDAELTDGSNDTERTSDRSSRPIEDREKSTVVGRTPVMNSPTSARTAAESPSNHKCSLPESSTYWAPGIWAARYLPCWPLTGIPCRVGYLGERPRNQETMRFR